MALHSYIFALSQHILPLPIVHTISCTGTLFVFIIDFLLNSVKINSKQAVGIVAGVIGALMATNGPVLTSLIDPSYKYETEYEHYISRDNLITTVFSILFLASMTIWAVGIVITKWATANTFQNNFVLGLGLTFAGALGYPYLETKASYLELGLSVLFTSIPMIIGQWMFIASLTMTKQTGVLNMFNFSTVIFAYLISVFRYHETPNFITNVGVLFVFFGVWKTVFNK
jgi:drug/metabolite transporter (DMT)-like permease